MAIAHVTTGTLLEETAATHEVSAPASIVDGNLLFAVAGIFAAAETLTMNEGGWTKIDELQNTAQEDTTIAAWWKIASSESGAYTISHATSTIFKGAIVQYSGVNESTPMDATSTQATHTTDSVTHTPADITTVTDQAWALSLIIKAGGSSNGIEPSGSTSRVESAGNGRYIGFADEGPLSVGAHSFADWTDLGSGGDADSITFALRPSGAIAAIHHHRQLIGAV